MMMCKRMAVLVLVVGFLAGYCPAATMCGQEFEFFGMSGSVLWIGETVGGECYYSQLLTVAVGDEGAVCGKAMLKEKGKWEGVREMLAGVEMRKIRELRVNEEGWFGFEGGKWQVSASGGGEEILAAYEKFVKEGGSQVVVFNEQKGDEAVVLPSVKGGKAKLVYAYERGLYADYEIERVYYFERAGLAVVFTKQERPGVGMDSMHGFILMKIED